MKIAMIIRASARKQLGGDFVQLKETARALENFGAQVTLHFVDEKIKYSDYDILHFSNLIRPSDILRHVLKTDVPFVVSSIFVQYQPEDSGIKNQFIISIFRHMPFFLEYIKTILRALMGKDMFPCLLYILMGQKKAINLVINKAKYLLPNSYSELSRIENALNRKISNYKIVNNGVSDIFFSKINPDIRFKDSIVSVGRIEPLKNQLMLIRASLRLPYKFFIIGSPSANKQYYQQCREEAGENVIFIERMNQQELTAAFSSAKLHVLLSLFETTGLVSLEAAACGCNVIVTDRGDQREYFEKFSTFCDPESLEDIVNKIIQNMQLPRNAFNQEKIIMENFRWSKAAESTFSVYNTILGNEK